MAIDARIAAVTVVAPEQCDHCCNTGQADNGWDACGHCHGATKEHPVVRLRLEAREEGGLPGQPVLTLIDPPTTDPNILSGLVGTEIWGNSTDIMVGEHVWAERLSYSQIRLVR